MAQRSKLSLTSATQTILIHCFFFTGFVDNKKNISPELLFEVAMRGIWHTWPGGSIRKKCNFFTNQHLCYPAFKDAVITSSSGFKNVSSELPYVSSSAYLCLIQWDFFLSVWPQLQHIAHFCKRRKQSALNYIWRLCGGDFRCVLGLFVTSV